MRFEKGKKYTKKYWRQGRFLLILEIGNYNLFVLDDKGQECMWNKADPELIPYTEPKKPKRVAPAMIERKEFYDYGFKELFGLFENELEAKKVVENKGHKFIRWPARENDFYEVDDEKA